MNMSESDRQKAFPVHIDLGHKVGDTSMPMVVGMKSKGAKPRMYYPRVYIDSLPGLEQLPKEGCMLVEFVRTKLSVNTPTEGKETTGVELELRALCLPEDMEEDLAETLSDAFKAPRKSKKTEAYSDDGEDD